MQTGRRWTGVEQTEVQGWIWKGDDDPELEVIAVEAA